MRSTLAKGVVVIAAGAALAILSLRGPWRTLSTDLAAQDRGRAPPGLTNHPPPSFRCCEDAEAIDGKGGSAISGAYEIVRDWPKLPHPDFVFSTVAGFAIDGDRMVAATRGVFDRNTGEIVENWSQWNDLLRTRQRLLISPYDPKKEVWVSGSGSIMRFSNDGRLT